MQPTCVQMDEQKSWLWLHSSSYRYGSRMQRNEQFITYIGSFMKGEDKWRPTMSLRVRALSKNSRRAQTVSHRQLDTILWTEVETDYYERQILTWVKVVCPSMRVNVGSFRGATCRRLENSWWNKWRQRQGGHLWTEHHFWLKEHETLEAYEMDAWFDFVFIIPPY